MKKAENESLSAELQLVIDEKLETELSIEQITERLEVLALKKEASIFALLKQGRLLSEIYGMRLNDSESMTLELSTVLVEKSELHKGVGRSQITVLNILLHS